MKIIFILSLSLLSGCTTIEYKPYERLNPITITSEDAIVAKHEVKNLILGTGATNYNDKTDYIYYNHELIETKDGKVFLK